MDRIQTGAHILTGTQTGTTRGRPHIRADASDSGGPPTPPRPSYRRLAIAILLMGALGAGTASCKPSQQEVVDDFYELWFTSNDTWRKNEWMGVPTLQNPFDVWVTQEILWEVKPDLVVEAGTFRGGSALLWASLLEEINDQAQVVTIDVKDQTRMARTRPIWNRRVTFLQGSSIDPAIVEKVSEMAKGKRVVVILDSLHTVDHVLAELHAYAPLVPVGSYVIVQDGFVNGHPVKEGWGPGPYEAINRFLAESNDFEADRSRERLIMTYNPMGFLRRVH